MSTKVVLESLYQRVVELSATIDTGYQSVSMTQLLVGFADDSIALCQVDASLEEGQQVVRLSLTPAEMADLLQAYQSYLHDQEMDSCTKTNDDLLGDLGGHPF